ncbi:hypothetical protein LCGC14_2277700 [marine sediment metagenome]|uniref:Uncharacterized protein n=1 Tax=marine sediment metagenome TaxID=412755 RepID=A0A0F9CV07_9ZZZZ
MEGKQIYSVIRTKILELEDKLMDVIIISNKYDRIPVPVFEQEMNSILRKIEHLERLVP